MKLKLMKCGGHIWMHPKLKSSNRSPSIHNIYHITLKIHIYRVWEEKQIWWNICSEAHGWTLWTFTLWSHDMLPGPFYMPNISKHKANCSVVAMSLLPTAYTGKSGKHWSATSCLLTKILCKGCGCIDGDHPCPRHSRVRLGRFFISISTIILRHFCVNSLNHQLQSCTIEDP